MTEELEFRPQMVAEWDRSLSYQKYRETSSVETICWKERCWLAKFNGKSKELEFDGKSMMHEQPAAYQEPKNAGGKRDSWRNWEEINSK